jgi:hypothetical protein
MNGLNVLCWLLSMLPSAPPHDVRPLIVTIRGSPFHLTAHCRHLSRRMSAFDTGFTR